MTRKILQTLSHPDRIGGIQSVAKSLNVVLESLNFDSKSVDLTWEDFRRLRHHAYELKALVVHGMSNIVTLKALIFYFLCLIVSKQDIKLIWQPHYHPFKHHRRPLLAKVYFLSVNRLLAKRAFSIIAITPDEQEELRNLTRHENIICIPNFINNSSFRSRFIDHSDSKTLLMVGRNDRNKNFKLVTDRINDLQQLGFKLKIITPVRNSIPHSVEVFSDLKAEEYYLLISQAKAILIPSHYEAFSLVALEAAVNGVPVLCSSKTKISSFEVMKKSVVITDFDNQDWINILKKLPDIEMKAKKHRKLIRNYFSQSKYAQNWIKILEKV